MSLIKEERVYFHGLEEFRAIAALMVYFHHVELFKSREGFGSLIGKQYFHKFIDHAGTSAVIGFFVLSGFLITYLLLREKEVTGTIKVKAFYIRRVLRIWPLYFLIVFIGFVFMPLLNRTGWFTNQHYYPKIIEEIEYSSLPLFLLFLSNIALKFFKPVAAAAQSWSVSVEEQFYLLWPNIIKHAKGIKQTVIIVLVLLIVKLWIEDVIVYFYGKNTLSRILKTISIQYMCIGSLAAIFLYTKNVSEKFTVIFKSRILLAIVVLLIGFELVKYNQSMVLSILFALLILFVITQKIEMKPLKYLGKISYGIYMLHPLFIFISFSIAANFKDGLMFNITLYSLSFIFTIVASGFSFKYFESPILRYKKKHTIIESGAK